MNGSQGQSAMLMMMDIEATMQRHHDATRDGPDELGTR
jgi:hypothetical protein